MLTDAQLEGLAAQALNLAKRDKERGQFICLLASYDQQEGLHRMSKVEKIIADKLGENWLNNGRAKDLAFDLLRRAVQAMPPDAVIFVTAANMFKATAKMETLSIDEQRRRIERGHDAHHQMAAEGYFEIIDCLIAVAQTPARICHRLQAIPPRGHQPPPPETTFFNQEEFDGRLKFYGEEPSAECYDNKTGRRM